MSSCKTGGRMELEWGAEGRKKKKILLQGHLLPKLGRGDWRELSYCFWWLRAAAVLASLSGMVQEDLLPYLRQTLIYLRHYAPTANNQLKLAYFFTFVTEPAALSQLCLYEQGSTDPEKVWVVTLKHFFPLSSCLFFFLAMFITLVFLVTVKSWNISHLFCR